MHYDLAVRDMFSPLCFVMYATTCQQVALLNRLNCQSFNGHATVQHSMNQ